MLLPTFTVILVYRKQELFQMFKYWVVAYSIDIIVWDFNYDLLKVSENKLLPIFTDGKCSAVVVITTAQLHLTKPEFSFCTGSNPACSMLEICNIEDLWQWSQLNPFVSEPYHKNNSSSSKQTHISGSLVDICIKKSLMDEFFTTGTIQIT